MNFTDHRYDEQDFQRDSAAFEVAEMAREERDMQDILIENTPRETQGKLVKCCDNPAMFTLVECLERDPHTGVFTEDFYECVCGSRIGSEDFSMLCSWASEQSTWAPIDEETAGPIVPEVMPPARVTIPRKVA